MTKQQIMGQSNTVDFKNFETKQQIDNFIKQTETDTQELKLKLSEVDNEMNKRIPSEIPDKLMKLYLDVDCACSIPRTVLWLSTTKREECTRAKLNMYNGIISTTNDIVNFNKLTCVYDDASKHITHLDEIIDKNKS